MPCSMAPRTVAGNPPCPFGTSVHLSVTPRPPVLRPPLDECPTGVGQTSHRHGGPAALDPGPAVEQAVTDASGAGGRRRERGQATDRMVWAGVPGRPDGRQENLSSRQEPQCLERCRDCIGPGDRRSLPLSHASSEIVPSSGVARARGSLRHACRAIAASAGVARARGSLSHACRAIAASSGVARARGSLSHTSRALAARSRQSTLVHTTRAVRVRTSCGRTIRGFHQAALPHGETPVNAPGRTRERAAAAYGAAGVHERTAQCGGGGRRRQAAPGPVPSRTTGDASSW